MFTTYTGFLRSTHEVQHLSPSPYSYLYFTMSLSRRKFLSTAPLAAVGAIILPGMGFAAGSNQQIPEAIPEPGGYSSEGEYWEALRLQFPLTHDRIYLNTGTMGVNPYPVLEEVKKGLQYTAESGEYGGGEIARGVLASFVGVKESEISLTHNTTEGINVVAWGLPLKAGDEVIMTTHEHVGNALPWLNRAKLHGIVIRTFKPARHAEENLSRIKKLIGPKTRAIAVPHVTCTTGTVLPVKEIAALAKRKGLFCMIDGAHGTGSMRLNIQDIGCDFYASCTHKWLCGPAGTGYLYVGEELLDTLQAYWVGGYSGDFDITTQPPEMKPLVKTAHRYDFATQSAALYKGVAKAVGFMETVGMERVEKRIRSLAAHLQEGLMAMHDKVEMLSPTEPESRSMMIGFRLKNMDYQKFGELAAKEHFRIRLVPESHLNSIRISTHIYNNHKEVDRFLELVKSV